MPASIRHVNRADALPGIAHKADWYRLYLLARYGGVWMDTGIILQNGKALDALYDELLYSTTADYLGFNDGTQSGVPIVDNWFMMSKKGGAFVTDFIGEV